MTLPLWIIAVVTFAETALVVMVFLFFLRLKKSESTLSQLQESQEVILERIYRNTELEHDLIESFTQRQEQLVLLNNMMEERIKVLQKLLKQAEGLARSPQFLREVIHSGRAKGQTPAQIARATGLTVDEVEIILSQK